MNDPYPTDLAAIDEQVLGFAPNSADPAVRALNRIATALEQIALNQMDHPQTPQRPQLAALPPVQTKGYGGGCPIHNQSWKIVPAGISKKTGNAYDAFQACPVKGCDQRPPR